MPVYALRGKRVWVAGHRGMVGSALVRRLASEDCEVLTVGRETLDLRDGAGVSAWMEQNRPQAVVLAAATVGGIVANDTYPADFLFDNLQIEANIIRSAFDTKVEKLLFLGSSCIYPRKAPQPIPESALLTGPLEPTNEWYAIAKIAGLKLCQAYRKQHGCDFISAMPTNLYGPGDSYDLTKSHVLPALMRKAHEAKLAKAPNLVVWGTGTPRRELLHCDDAADAMIFLLKNWSQLEHVNVGVGEDIAIGDLAHLVAEVVGYEGEIVFDTTKPDGMMRKLLDVSTLTSLGWTAPTGLREGIVSSYAWFLSNAVSVR